MSYTNWIHPKRKKKSVKRSAASRKAWRTRKKKYGKSGAPKRSKSTPWYLTESQARRRKKAGKYGKKRSTSRGRRYRKGSAAWVKRQNKNAMHRAKRYAAIIEKAQRRVVDLGMRDWKRKENARAKDKTYQSLKAAYERASTYYDAAFTREAEKMGVNLQHTMRRSTIDAINAKIAPLYEESRRTYRALVAHPRS